MSKLAFVLIRGFKPKRLSCEINWLESLPKGQKRPRFHVEHNVAPRYVRPLVFSLLAFGPGSKTELIRRLGDQGIRISRVHLNRNLAFLRDLGLIQIIGSPSGSETDGVRLTELGESMGDFLQFNKPAFYDLIHIMHYAGWSETEPLQMPYALTFRLVCDRIWEKRPFHIDDVQVSLWVMEQLRDRFAQILPDPASISVSRHSVYATRSWLSSLQPSVFEPDSTHSVGEGRPACSREMIEAAVDYLYRRDSYDYGSSMMLTENRLQELAKVTWVQPTYLPKMIKMFASTSRTLDLKQSVHGASVSLSESPTILQAKQAGR